PSAVLLPYPFPALSPTLPSGLLRRFHDRTMRHGIMRIAIDARLDFRTEVADQALYRPRRRIAECADRMTFDLLRDLEQHVDLALLGITRHHALHHPPHPARAFTAGRALTAAFMLEEGGQPGNCADDIRRLVHDDHRSRPEGRLLVSHTVEIHDRVFHVLATDNRTGGAAGNDSHQVVPAAADTAGMLFDQLA